MNTEQFGNENQKKVLEERIYNKPKSQRCFANLFGVGILQFLLTQINIQNRPLSVCNLICTQYQLLILFASYFATNYRNITKLGGTHKTVEINESIFGCQNKVKAE